MTDFGKQETICGSSRPQVFLGKGVLRIHCKFTRDYPCRSVISIKLLCSLIEFALRRQCSPVNLLHILRISFPKITSGRLFLLLFDCMPFTLEKWTVEEKTLDTQYRFSCEISALILSAKDRKIPVNNFILQLSWRL